MRTFDIAFDIGTTNLEALLIDAGTGRTVSHGCLANPQKRYGADVVTRIERIRTEGLAAVTGALLGGMRELTETLLRDGAPGTPLSAVRAVAVSGNTILEHFAAGLDPSPIAVPPFVPETLFRSGTALRLPPFPEADAFFAPCASGYVGGDIISGMAALGLADAEELTLFVDIGTNGEIALGDRNGYRTCATAAGPAFSGAGMRGSDLIDAVAFLLKNGRLTPSGRFRTDRTGGPAAAELAAETPSGARPVSRTAVHNLQLAKGAVRAGIETMLSLTNRTAQEIRRLIVAGDFGAKIDAENAKRIGLLPDIPTDRITQPGNTSLLGARLLLSEEGRREALRTAGLCSYTDLSGNGLFADRYLRHINFEPEP